MSLKKLPSVLGDNDFIDIIKAKFYERKRHVEVPQSKELALDEDRIIGAVCNLYGIDRPRLFQARRGAFNEARSMAVYLCRHLRGASLTSIGKVFGIDSYSTVSSIIERFKERIQSDRNLMKKVEQLKIGLMRQGKT
jgi:chromosomal replication initiation ATPase DnaA